jgi:hypothetical protein
MIESTDLLLTDLDFPPDFKNFAHPYDYQIRSSPIDPEYIFHKYPGGNRLIYRISVYIGPETYTTLSFVCDTGAPKHLYLSSPAINTLQQYHLLKIDCETDISWIRINNKKVPIDVTPTVHAPANIIGLKLLCKLGLQLHEDEFTFTSAPRCW